MKNTMNGKYEKRVIELIRDGQHGDNTIITKISQEFNVTEQTAKNSLADAKDVLMDKAIRGWF